MDSFGHYCCSAKNGVFSWRNCLEAVWAWGLWPSAHWPCPHADEEVLSMREYSQQGFEASHKDQRLKAPSHNNKGEASSSNNHFLFNTANVHLQSGYCSKLATTMFNTRCAVLTVLPKGYWISQSIKYSISRLIGGIVTQGYWIL